MGGGNLIVGDWPDLEEDYNEEEEGEGEGRR